MDTFQMQALDVPQLDDNFDPNKVPENGEEFLMKVIYERKRCPAVVVREIKPKLMQTISIKGVNDMNEIIDSHPADLRPTKEWKEIQINDFSTVRDKICLYRKKINDNMHMCETTNESILPKAEDEAGWKSFCCNNQPFLNTILQINQKTLQQLLEYQLNWLQLNVDTAPVNLSTTEAWLGLWIYSVMVCLITPLEPNVFSILREIAKVCILLRNATNNHPTKATPFNLFLSIISIYFGQLDMANYV